MSGLTAAQYILRMDEWNEVIKHKVRALTLGARFYSILNLVVILGTASTHLVLLVLDSLFLTDPNLNYNARVAISLVALLFQIILAIFTGFNAAVQPGTKSNNCGLCAKQYSELSREIDVEISKHENFDDDESYPRLAAKSLYYSEREQIILYAEPLLLFIGHKKGSVLNVKNKDIKDILRRRQMDRNLDSESINEENMI